MNSSEILMVVRGTHPTLVGNNSVSADLSPDSPAVVQETREVEAVSSSSLGTCSMKVVSYWLVYTTYPRACHSLDCHDGLGFPRNFQSLRGFTPLLITRLWYVVLRT